METKGDSMSATKVCRTCKQHVPIIGGFTKMRTTKDGLDVICRACKSITHKKWAKANSKAIVEKARRWRLDNLERSRKWQKAYGQKMKKRNRAKRYGLTVDELDAMLEAQGHKCASCEDPLGDGARQGIDHDHITGRVRGILCCRCNLAIGLLLDDMARMIGLLNYMHKAAKIDEADEIDAIAKNGWKLPEHMKQKVMVEA